MVEHKICRGCKYNDYPVCLGFKMNNGHFLNIENQRADFQCGQKDMDKMTDYSIKVKSESELKIEELESRLKKLEEVKK